MYLCMRVEHEIEEDLPQNMALIKLVLRHLIGLGKLNKTKEIHIHSTRKKKAKSKRQ